MPSIYDTPDDPNRVAGPGELRTDPDWDGDQAERDPDYDRDMAIYEGDLIRDCAAVAQPTLRDQLRQIGSDAVFAARLDHDFQRIVGSGK